MKLMAPGLRKFALTIHVVSSVGWLGAVVSFLVLAIAGLTSAEPLMIRGAYLAMDLIGWSIIFPLSLASLISGIGQALGTVWGLFRHYWVLIKLIVTALAAALLLLHLQPVTQMAGIASATDLSPDGHGRNAHPAHRRRRRSGPRTCSGGRALAIQTPRHHQVRAHTRRTTVTHCATLISH